MKTATEITKSIENIVKMVLGFLLVVGVISVLDRGESPTDVQGAIDACYYASQDDLHHAMIPCMQDKGYNLFTHERYCPPGQVGDKVLQPRCYETKLQTLLRQAGFVRG